LNIPGSPWLRGSDHDRVAGADERPQILDRLGNRPVLDVVVRIERRQPGEILVDEHPHALGGEPRQRREGCGVGRALSKAAGNREHAHGLAFDGGDSIRGDPIRIAKSLGFARARPRSGGAMRGMMD